MGLVFAYSSFTLPHCTYLLKGYLSAFETAVDSTHFLERNELPTESREGINPSPTIPDPLVGAGFIPARDQKSNVEEATDSGIVALFS